MTKEELIEIIYEKVMSFVLPKDKTLPYIRCGIGDVLDGIEKGDIIKNLNEKNGDGYDINDCRIEIIKLRTDKRKAIEHQSEECISFIYSLIAKWTKDG